MQTTTAGDHIDEAMREREWAIPGSLTACTGNEQFVTAILLSANTMKWQMRCILENPEAHNRSEAVFIARRVRQIEARK